MGKIGKGIDFKNMGISLVVLAAGSYLMYLGIFQNYTISIRRFALPQWSIYVFSGIVITAGIFLFYSSLKSKKCLDCRKVLKEGEVKFPLDQKDAVRQAADTLNAEQLKGLSLKNDDNDCVMMNFNYCPNCTKVAELSVTSREDWNDTVLIPEKEISGDSVVAFVHYVEEFGEVEEE